MQMLLSINGEIVKSQSKQQKPTDELSLLAYGAGLVARMYPNYALFTEFPETRDHLAFSNILNLVWEYISGKNQRIDFEKQQDKLEAITPDPDSFDLYGVWPALDATVALGSLLSACERWDVDEINAIELVSLSTIDQYLDVTAGGDDNNRLYSAERQYSEALCSVIEENKDNRGGLVMAVKGLVRDVVVSNIGLEAG